MSVVIEQAGNFVAELVDDIQNLGRADQVDETSQLGEHGENGGFFFFRRGNETIWCFSINFRRDEKKKKKIDTKVVGWKRKVETRARARVVKKEKIKREFFS